MSAVAKTQYFFRTALGGMWRAPFVHVIAIASLAIALSGYGLARVAGGQIDALVASLGGEVELTVYLKPEVKAEDAEALRAAIAQRIGGPSKLVSPKEAIARLKESLGPRGATLDALSDNPLPWSVEASVPPLAREPASLRALADKLRTLEFVDSVDYGEQALDRLTSLATGLKLGSLVAFTLVFLTTIVVVSATLQLAIYARREEIEIQKLVGATNRFVRAPFLIEGVVQGLLGASVAFGLLLAAGAWFTRHADGFGAFLKVPGDAALVSPRLYGEMLVAGVTVGLLGSVVAVRRFLRV